MTSKGRQEHVAYSFIVDEHPKFAYQGWLLARSLQQACAAETKDIHVQFTSEVPTYVRDKFSSAGCAIHEIERFGDGKFCNKASQLPNLADCAFDRIVLLDTDTIAIGDIRPFLVGDAVQAKTVDLPNPRLETLIEIYAAAGGAVNPRFTMTDAGHALTLFGNANGGLYTVPRRLLVEFSTEWRRWISWLMVNDQPLRDAGSLGHIDQVGVALATQVSRIAFSYALSNVNYYIHFQGLHRYFDSMRPIVLLHYHDAAMNQEGLLAAPYTPNELESQAIAKANRQIEASFDEELLREYRCASRP
jgi:hypothetical protein